MKDSPRLWPAVVVGCLLLLALACTIPTVTPDQTPFPSPTPPPTLMLSPLKPPPPPLSVRLDAAISLAAAPVHTPFILHFSQPMATDYAGAPLSFSPAAEGRFFWDDTATTLIFVPQMRFEPGTRYEIHLNPALVSAEGRPFTTLPQWTLETLPAPLVYAPQVFDAPLGANLDEVEPRSLSTALRNRYPTLRIAFDRPMDQDSVKDALSIEPPVPLALTWAADGVLLAHPSAPLTPGTRYVLSLSDRARDLAGTPLQAAQQWSLSMTPLVARVSTPTAHNHDLPVSIAFNYPVDPESFTRANRFNPAVNGTWEWNAERTQATFVPATVWPTYANVEVGFRGGLYDASGDRLPTPESFSFTTPPPLLAYSPQGKAVHPGTTIDIVFDRPMDHAASEAAFVLIPPVAGTFSWEETTLTFTPVEGGLLPNTNYAVIIGASAQAQDGARLFPQPFSWDFTTGEFGQIASFGSGPNAQVLDADGRRAIQYVLHRQSSAMTTTFELYQLSLEQYLDRYASGFRGVAGSEQRPISTAGAPLVRQWADNPDASRSSSPYRYQSLHEVIIPEDVPPGLYILNLRADYLESQLILVLSRNTLLVKQAEGQLVTWVADIPDMDGTGGAPRPNVEVGVYARDGSRLAQGFTDAQGVFRTEVSTDPQPLIVIARQGDALSNSDITASGLSNEWRTGYSPWWGWWHPSPAALDYAVHIYTDRPIYRPGQTVFFKAIVRADADVSYSLLPPGSPVTARIRDARNNVVQTFALETNAFSTVHGEFAVAEGAMLGDYAVEVVVGEESHQQTFKVEEYRKPDYHVTLTPQQPAYVEGDLVVVTVDTAYYFGEPVVNAPIEIYQYQLGWYWGYWYDSTENVWFRTYDRLTQGRTDDNGRFTFSFRAKLGDYPRQRFWDATLKQAVWGLEATVDDGSRQTVSGFATIHIYDAAELLQVDTGGYFHRPGAPFDIVAQVADIFGAPVAGRELQVALLRWNPRTFEYDDRVQTLEAVTGPDGRAVAQMTIAEPGFYLLRVSGADEAGRRIEYTGYIYAFERMWWGAAPSEGLRISADRDRYAPGDTARLLIQSDFSGPALLTFERGMTHREQLVELTAPVTLVDVPVLATDVPNIFVTVNAWVPLDTSEFTDRSLSLPDGELRTARVELTVPADEQLLTVTITADRERYAPRDEAEFTIRVTDSRGRPVVAEVSLALVDEAIFALSANLTAPISETFYAPRENIVRTYHALALQRVLYMNGMGGGGNGGLEGSPRSDFPDTAAWLPTLTTDANGEARLTLRLPDSLTSWRLTAIAATRATQVGESTFNIVTHQPVIARPILPRFLTAGDETTLTVMLHNYAEESQTLTVTLALSPTTPPGGQLTLAAPDVQTLTLEPGEQRSVTWQAVAATAGPVFLLAQARAEGVLVDAVRLPLTIAPLSVPDVTTEVGHFTGTLASRVNIPVKALDLSVIRIELSRSIAGTLLEGLEYLTGFPFGCVEQTMSKALPNAVVGRAINALGVTAPTLQADLPPKINASVQRLYGYQHNDGGWGWWYDDSTDAYQTAWVVFGLATTAEAGYEVDAGVIARGVDWLTQHLAAMDPRTRAYALYSMAVAGSPHLTATQALAADFESLDTFSQAGLALALHTAGDSETAARIVAHLAATVTEREGLAHWGGAAHDGYYAQKVMASDTRSTALALSAFTRIAPEHPLIPGIVRWLMSQRRMSGWGSTNETAFSIIALTDHLAATSYSEAAASTTYTVTLNGVQLAGGALGRGAPAVVLEIPRSQLRAGRNALALSHDGTSPLYYVITRRIYLAQSAIEAAGDVVVTRAYRDPATGKTVDTVAPGQLVEVQVRVKMPDRASYIIVEDPLPGGLEALNERLNTTSHIAVAGTQPSSYWQEYGYNYKEVRDDRVVFFITEFLAGERTFAYMARATHAGTFVALPVEVTAMYDAAVWGRSDSARLRIAE